MILSVINLIRNMILNVVMLYAGAGLCEWYLHPEIYISKKRYPEHNKYAIVILVIAIIIWLIFNIEHFVKVRSERSKYKYIWYALSIILPMIVLVLGVVLIVMAETSEYAYIFT